MRIRSRKGDVRRTWWDMCNPARRVLHRIMYMHCAWRVDFALLHLARSEKVARLVFIMFCGHDC